MNFDDLLAKAEKVLGNRKELAARLSMGEDELSRKMNGGRGWMGPEINTLLSITGMTITDNETLQHFEGTLKYFLTKSNGG